MLSDIRRVINAPIVSHSLIAPKHFLMRMESFWLGLHSKVGQFVMVKVQEKTTDPLLRIPLSIHSMDKKGISLLYKVVGTATKILSSKKPKEYINIVGPLGNGFNIDMFKQKKGLEAILVGGGCGVAPLYALAKLLRSKNKKVIMFIGASSREEVLCIKEFMSLGVKVYVATEDGSQGYKGYVTKLLEQYFDKFKPLSKIAVYASGPNPMLDLLARITKRFSIPTQLSLEAYMACGIGVCCGCAINTAVGYKLCCKDGPVFDARVIESLS